MTVLVIEVNKDSAFGWLEKEIWDWIREAD